MKNFDIMLLAAALAGTTAKPTRPKSGIQPNHLAKITRRGGLTGKQVRKARKKELRARLAGVSK